MAVSTEATGGISAEFMTQSFLLIIFSAFFHALWNILLKLSKDKHAYTLHIHVAASVFMTVFMLIFFPESLRFHQSTVIFALLSSFFFALYQVGVAEAYRFADVSMVYPITTSSPLFIIIWAHFLLGENISRLGFLGIILIISGCYVMNMTKGGNKSAARGVIFAILAALCYSFGAMGDKMGVDSVDTMLYIYLMTVFMSIFLWPIVWKINRGKKKEPIEWKIVMIGGIVVLISTIFYRLGLVEMPISYAAALRQVSSFFGLMMGIIFFKESYGLQRAIGCAVIVSGIVIIRLGI